MFFRYTVKHIKTKISTTTCGRRSIDNFPKSAIYYKSQTIEL